MASSNDNTVTIKCASITSIAYIDNSLVITGGQPSSPPPTISQSGDTWSITINCGRKGSVTIASQFTSKSGGVSNVISPYSSSDKSPSNLNFYFGITVCFNIQNETFYTDLYLGQGNTSSRNNWWIGGKNVATLYNSIGIVAIPTVPGGEVNEVFSITGGVSNFNLNPYINTSNSNEQAGWMKTLDDSKLITDINIPGTHDSAAINSSSLHTPYACHYNTISKQLLYGVRLFDVRLSIHDNSGTYTFVTCHSDIGAFGLNEYQSFPSLLDECKTFLTANPSEFIAMSIKVDDWNGIPDSQQNAAYSQLATLLTSYPTFSQPTVPTLSSSRGKIFLMNRMNTDLSLGVPITWPKNTAGSMSPSHSQVNRSFNLYAQDKYENLGSGSVSAERDKYNVFVNAITQATSGQMLINFASGVKRIISGVYIMDYILQYFGLKNASSRPALLGWSLFDYITSNYSTSTYGNINVLQMIISSNFGYSKYPDEYTVDTVHDEL
ncbi:MAG TPA: hypothetical protein PLP23_06725 [Panacibacter sp.]|nr:hypothetical protein [Panacibacter sp.]